MTIDFRDQGVVSCKDLVASDATEAVVSSAQAAALHEEFRRVAITDRDRVPAGRWRSMLIRTEDA